MRARSASHVHWAMLNPKFGRPKSILRDSPRPPSDIPDSAAIPLVVNSMTFPRQLISRR
jgi:hypothetical protein